MRGSSVVLTSFLAASTAALSSCSSGENDAVFERPAIEKNSRPDGAAKKESGSLKEQKKFAPRFDGLRFIETTFFTRVVPGACAGWAAAQAAQGRGVPFQICDLRIPFLGGNLSDEQFGPLLRGPYGVSVPFLRGPYRSSEPHAVTPAQPS